MPANNSLPASPNPAEPEDQELVESARRNDPGAVGTLLTRHQSRIYGLCYRIVHNRDLAADLAQDAMVKLIQGLDSYDGRALFTTWMTRIVINLCLSKLRSEKLRRHASLDATLADRADRETSLSRTIEQSREPEGHERVQSEEERREILAALLVLDPEQRAILVLRDQRGLDYDLIGEVLGINVGTVKSRLFRARAALREAAEIRARKQSGERIGAGGSGKGRQGQDRAS
jgi:RNA polymerase sigma-70 factor (ECF subfamily)